MSKPIYYALKLDEQSKGKLLSLYPPKHTNVYAEHATIAFKPARDVENTIQGMIGLNVNIVVVGYAEDDLGQAVAIHGIGRFDGGIPHITISCAAGTTPVYSNKLLSNGFNSTPNVELSGKIGYVDDNKQWNF